MKPVLVLLVSLCCAGLQQAAWAQAACAGKTGEAAATCQKEEAAARQEEKRGELQSGINYRDNALARCDPLTGNDKEDCLRRVEGEGMARGSVESGGIYRETRTITIGPTPGGQASGSSDAAKTSRP